MMWTCRLAPKISRAAAYGYSLLWHCYYDLKCHIKKYNFLSNDGPYRSDKGMKLVWKDAR